MDKKWYTSKTLWANALAIGASFAANTFGMVIAPEVQVSILVVVNFVLRIVTKSEIVW